MATKGLNFTVYLIFTIRRCFIQQEEHFEYHGNTTNSADNSSIAYREHGIVRPAATSPSNIPVYLSLSWYNWRFRYEIVSNSTRTTTSCRVYSPVDTLETTRRGVNLRYALPLALRGAIFSSICAATFKSLIVERPSPRVCHSVPEM